MLSRSFAHYFWQITDWLSCLFSGHGSADIDHHPGPAIAALMKLSFDEEHRHAICTLGMYNDYFSAKVKEGAVRNRIWFGISCSLTEYLLIWKAQVEFEMFTEK